MLQLVKQIYYQVVPFDVASKTGTVGRFRLQFGHLLMEL